MSTTVSWHWAYISSISESDRDFGTFRMDRDGETVFEIRPYHHNHGLQNYRTLYLGLQVNYGCRKIIIDLFHFAMRGNVSRTDAKPLGKLYSFPDLDYAVRIGDVETFSIEFLRNYDVDYNNIRYVSQDDIFDGTKISYAIERDFWPLQNFTRYTNDLGENVTYAEYTLGPITKNQLGISMFSFNAAPGVFITVPFALRLSGDRKPAVGISPCYTDRRATWHEDGWPVIPRIRGEVACVVVQLHGVPLPEVAVAITNREASHVTRLLTGLFGSSEGPILPHDQIDLYQLPASSDDQWLVVAATNQYKMLHVRVKVAAITKTQVEVQEKYFYVGERGQTLVRRDFENFSYEWHKPVLRMAHSEL